MPVKMKPESYMTRDYFTSRINELIIAKRQTWITALPGQDSIYKDKLDDALRFTVGAYTSNPDNFPWIKAIADKTGKAPVVIANNIKAARATWVTNCSRLEALREYVKDQLSNPDLTPEEIEAIFISFYSSLSEI